MPEEPCVGTEAYPASIYGTWDPNWRGFVGTTLIVAMEEFSDLISEPTQHLILESLHNATKGDEYRFGNIDNSKDNLYPAYSNPVSSPARKTRKIPTLTFVVDHESFRVWLDRPSSR